MSTILRRSVCLPALLAAACVMTADPTPAQAQVSRGYNRVVRIYATGQERNRQRNLWVLEVHLKQMRMQWVDITVDAETGETKRELVWYLVYKAINRPIEIREDATDTEPSNDLDPVPQRPKFIPEFMLTTYPDPETEIPDHEYMDEVLPDAVAAINLVESHRPGDPVLADTVSVIRDLPEPAAEDDEDGEWIHGIVTWRNVDPETDFFKVTLSGFSNGYDDSVDPDDNTIVWRKVLIQKFTRRGDRFDPTQVEFNYDGKPQWTHQPESATEDVPTDSAAAATP